MKIKAGARVHGLRPEILLAVMAADQIWKELGIAEGVTITSGVEGTHSTFSRHYQGNAVDFRSRYFDAATKAKAAEQLKSALGPDFNVVTESTHIHVAWRPRSLA